MWISGTKTENKISKRKREQKYTTELERRYV